MSNIQKEISQLEHWLNNLPDDTPNHQSEDNTKYTDAVDRLSEQVLNQQLTLNNILERLDILEGAPRVDREVFINEDDDDESARSPNDPWLDNNCEPLQNELVGDDASEPLYTIHKKTSRTSSVATPSIIPDVPEDRSIPPDIDSDDEKVAPAPTPIRITKHNEPEHPEEQKVEEEVVVEEEEEEEEEEVVVEEEEEEEVVVEEEEEEEVVVEEEEEEEVVVEEEEVVVEEEEEEEEEEEGMELEEIEYNDVKYYKDGENFIYSIDKSGEPSENPVGYWKEKTQTIAFYKTK
jgi:hypothetical protein